MKLFVCTAVSALGVASLVFLCGCSGSGATPELAGTNVQSSVNASTPVQPLKAVVTPGSSGDLRVMSFNLRVRTIFDGPNIWDARRGSVVDRVREFDPDLLGTQEGLAGQTDYLKTQLPEYAFIGVGRDDGGRFGEMCGVFFRSARFEAVDSGHFWLSQKPERPGSHGWGAMFPRMVTWVKLRPRDGGQTICWFNTHFDAWNRKARFESAKLLRQRMTTIAGALPCVVTGDFNADEDTDCYRTMLIPGTSVEQALSDTYRVANRTRSKEEGTIHSFSGSRRGERIDWILASAQFAVVNADIDRTRGRGGYPSDHFPVTATLRPTMVRQQPVAAAAE